MKNRYKVEVSDDTNETKEYIVKINDSKFKILKLIVSKNFIRLLLVCIYVFTCMIFFVKCNNTQNNDICIRFYMQDKMDSNLIKEKTIKKQCKDPTYFVGTTVFAIAGLVCFTILLLKDDKDIRYEKLSALKEIKDNDGFKEVLKDISVEQIEVENLHDKSEELKDCNDKVIIKYKNQKAEFAKVYMNSITEI